jgi:hypothetical protein
LGGETSKAKAETRVETTTNFGTDVDAFDTYLQSVFEAAIYSSLVAWGSSGGANTATTPWQTQTYYYDVDDTPVERKIALLLDELGPQNGVKEQSLQDLSTMVKSNFIATLDTTLFEERGYEPLVEVLPEVSISTNEEATTTFTLAPHIKLVRKEREYSFTEHVVQLDIGVKDILEEIVPLLTAIDTSALSYSLSSHVRQTDAPLRLCGYRDTRSTSGPCAGGQCSLIRIMYDAPLKLYSSYRFDFIVKDEVVDCTP